MAESIAINDLIELREAVPEHNLTKGQIGCVRQIFDNEEYEVEFTDWIHSIGKFRLKADQLQPLKAITTIDESAFWRMIEQAKADSDGDDDQQVQIIVDRLAALPLADVLTFGDWMYHFKGIAYRNDLWAAAYIIGGGCSDDGFSDFRAWLIAQGKAVYEGALRNPETLVDIATIENEGRLEHMNYVVSLAHEKKFGSKEPIFRGRHPLPELTGAQWQEKDLDALYPKLAEKFG